MAYAPRTFRKGNRTEVANSYREETDLAWDGWVPDTGAPITPSPAFSAAELAELRAAFGSPDPVLSDFVYDPATGNLLSYKEDGIPIVLTYNADGTVATMKRGSAATKAFSYASGNLVGVA